MMNRRQMIKVMGGTAIAAIVLANTGCSQRLPRDAVQAWDEAREESDPRRWVLAHAILAPSSHNLQSWRVDLTAPNTIMLYMDLNRLLPETDPYARQLVMSQGTFLELLDIAAREIGMRAEVTVFPQGEFSPTQPDERPVASIVLHQQSDQPADPLYRAIFNRHTNREHYSDRVAGPDVLRTISESTQPFSGFHGFVTAEQTGFSEHQQIARAAWAVEMTTPRTMLESYEILRIGPDEIAEHRDGVTVNDPIPRLLTRFGMMDRTQAPAPDSSIVRRQIREFDGLIDNTPMFFWTVTRDNSRTTQLASGRAFARMQLQATQLGLSMHPLQQPLQEYEEQAINYRAIHELCGATEPGNTVQMWGRLGYGPAVVPAPRRGLDDHLV